MRKFLICFLLLLSSISFAKESSGRHYKDESEAGINIQQVLNKAAHGQFRYLAEVMIDGVNKKRIAVHYAVLDSEYNLITKANSGLNGELYDAISDRAIAKGDINISNQEIKKAKYVMINIFIMPDKKTPIRKYFDFKIGD
ncbi:MAG: hypothetical protein LBD46_04675 [Endomicrobium sp.]|jgi:hypothetical protein|nr:hypothetical protein [Endomicrobium sp.]